jgi:post-segregation antitoxin (ccd killing protein)
VVRTQIQLTAEQAADLKRLAAARSVSMAAVIRDAVDAHLARERGPSWEERVERALSHVGRFHSGLDDLAENHDEYYVEAVESKWK